MTRRDPSKVARNKEKADPFEGSSYVRRLAGQEEPSPSEHEPEAPPEPVGQSAGQVTGASAHQITSSPAPKPEASPPPPEETPTKGKKADRIRTTVSLDPESLKLLEDLRYHARRQGDPRATYGELLDQAIRDLATARGLDE